MWCNSVAKPLAAPPNTSSGDPPLWVKGMHHAVWCNAFGQDMHYATMHHYASLCNGFDWAVSQGRHWTTWFNRGRMLRQALLLWLQGALQCRGQASSFAEFCIILIISYNTLIQRDEVWWSLGSEVRDLWDPAHDSSRLPDLMEEGLPMPLVSHSASPVHVRCHVSV